MEIREYVINEVADWDDEIAARIRFKDFSGQRADWETRFVFWRDLILIIAQKFDFLFLRPSQLRKDWFNRGGLSPLCLDHVLLVMYNEGDIARREDLVDPTTTVRLSQIFRKVRNLMRTTTPASQAMIAQQDVFIVMPVLKEKAARVVKLLTETHWTEFVVVTMARFWDICGGGPDQASVILSYLSAQGKARSLSLSKEGHSIQGVKVSLSASPVSGVSSLDSDILHLIWTTEMLEQQLGVIDQRCERSRKSALSSFHSGNKNVALRHMKALKLANESKEKCYALLNRVEEVLNVIANAESTKKVSEAIQIGAQAIKENKISMQEVEHSLQELEDITDLQKQVENAMGATLSYAFAEDEYIEEEFKKLELEIEGLNHHHPPSPKAQAQSAATETEASELTDLLSEALSGLKVADGPSSTTAGWDVSSKKTKNLDLETA